MGFLKKKVAEEKEKKVCETCNGTGMSTEDKSCPICGGSGNAE